ncbi:leucine-rich repeat domain-containing protein [Candidatus Palauibacter sp.]|uniref:leucine-rich repeat domain-containing protein n=1 Tax=Candidatus Palauibacter sp. TaxID=3101350 RepID=UPI003B5A5CEA
MLRTVRFTPVGWRAAISLALLAILSCGESPTTVPPPPPPSPRPATLSVNPTAAELTAFGDTLHLTAEVRDQNGQVMSGVSVTWASSSAGVATVNASGRVTAVADGVATITAASGSASGSASVTVAQEVSEVAVSPAADTLLRGETRQLEAEARDANGHAVAGAELTWASSDTSVISVDSTGLATAVAEGAAVVTAVSAGVAGRAELRVLPPEPATVVVTPAADTIAPGDTLRLAAEAFDGDGQPLPGASFTWSSDNESAARVDASGLVLGILEGAATITATTGAASGSSEITVLNPDRAALIALYESTGGPNWNDSRNWLTDAPVAAWAGVRVKGSRVSGLNFGPNNLRGPLPAEIGNLTELEDLTLWGNALTGSIPPEVGNLEHLAILNLHGNQMTGPLPAEIGNLVNLTAVNLRINGITGPIPPEVGNLRDLETLDLSNNRLTGPIPPELGNLSSLTGLNIYANGLTGPLPPALGRLASLETLTLSQNRIEGSIPSELGDLVALRRITLASNNLSSPIPPELGKLAELDQLDLGGNNLSGRLPPALGDLSLLRVLSLESNRLTGPIPRSFLQLGQLTAFRFRSNSGLCAPGTTDFVSWLEGFFFPGPFCNESDVAVLGSLHEATGGADWTNSDGWLANAATSEWHGVRADSLGRVQVLDLSGNGLAGRLPQNLGLLTELTELRIGGNALSGRLPLSLTELALRELAYAGTEICAPTDAAFRDWLAAVPSHDGTGLECEPRSDRDALESLYDATGGHNWIRRGNWLTDAPLEDWDGVNTDDEGRVIGLYLGGNRLTGLIPPELGELSKLETLWLVENGLSGPILPELGNLGNLNLLALLGNRLTGSIPPELGNLSRLESLQLSSNTLTGSIPPELGNLSSLERLDLAANALTGSIPPEIADLSNLENLDLSENSLTGLLPSELSRLSELNALSLRRNHFTGPIPPKFGDLHGLRELSLDWNNLSGPVPPELGRLTSLRLLGLANNAGLSGVLPAELTALRELDTFRAGGTELCVPSEERFISWLEGISIRRVALCARVSAYLTQAVQSREFPVPLVAGDEALLRVFVTSERAAGANFPPVRAGFFVGGTEIHSADIPPSSAPIPAEVTEGDLRASANALIPGDVVQAGLELVVEVDPDGTLDPALGVAGRIPETGRLRVDVRAMPTLDLTLVPFIWDQTPDSTIMDMVQGMVEDPEGHELLWGIRTLLPVGDLDVKGHAPVVTSTTRGRDLLHQTAAIRTMEGATGHYMGTITGRAPGFAGVAQRPGRASYARADAGVMAHELGHNMNLQHAPCGANSFLDPAFPHERGSIGAWGYDSRPGYGLVAPHVNDLMSYCRPQWISDYHFTEALRYRLRDEGTADAAVAAAKTKTLLLWGGVDGDGTPYLDPALVVRAAPTLPRPGGEYVVSGRTAAGAELFSLRFDMPELADSEDGSSFVFALPVEPEWADSLAEITLSGPDGAFTLDGETDLPVVILRDRDTGEVRGILRDMAPADLARGAAAGVSLEPGLEVLFSRGIPDSAEWRR